MKNIKIINKSTSYSLINKRSFLKNHETWVSVEDKLNEIIDFINKDNPVPSLGKDEKIYLINKLKNENESLSRTFKENYSWITDSMRIKFNYNKNILLSLENGVETE